MVLIVVAHHLMTLIYKTKEQLCHISETKAKAWTCNTSCTGPSYNDPVKTCTSPIIPRKLSKTRTFTYRDGKDSLRNWSCRAYDKVSSLSEERIPLLYSC
jgi:hypothetical protein